VAEPVRPVGTLVFVTLPLETVAYESDRLLCFSF
jgi:hypothetical protein